MNIIKTVLSILLISVILWNITVFAVDQTENIMACNDKEGFELYKCELKEICLEQDYWKTKDKIVWLEKNYDNEPELEEAKKTYRFNQNVIYKCWVLGSQEKAFNELTIKLVKLTDKTGILTTKIIPKIEEKLKQIKQLKLSNKCTNINYSAINKKALKKIALDQSTLEYCSYKYYLHFLNNREEKDLSVAFPEWKKAIWTKEINSIIIDNKNAIQDEMSHSMKMYPLAFETYVQYDSFIKIHIVLELLKEDYRAFRNKLYQTLHAINQVIYKIINAQST